MKEQPLLSSPLNELYPKIIRYCSLLVIKDANGRHHFMAAKCASIGESLFTETIKIGWTCNVFVFFVIEETITR